MADLNFNIIQLFAGFILAVLMAAASYRLKVLSLSGALGTILVGTIVFGLGGWPFSIPLLFFFITSTAMSKLKSDIKLKSLKIIEKAGPRDIRQVLANGGIASLCVIAITITGDERWFFLYLASLGVAAADTWATEIGTLLAGRPVSIINFKEVPPGSSGGVSIPGTLASIIGSWATVFISLPFTAYIRDLHILWYTSAAGFTGAIIDSLLGATIQGVYRCSDCRAIVEVKYHCGIKADRIRGMRVINNDMVNFLSNLIAVSLLGWLIF